MNRYLARHAFFYPVRYLRGEHVARYLRDVRDLERRTFEDVQQENWRRARTAVARAAGTIPYYGELCRRLGLDPLHWDTPDQLQMLPLLDKATIRQHYARLRTTRRCRVSTRSTSGSTGAPFVFEKDADAAAYMDAVMYHVYSWHGIEIGAPQARFWGMPFTWRGRATARLKDLLMNRIRCNAFRLAEAELVAFHRRLMEFRPEYFYGYPSVIYEFARVAVARGLKVPPLKAVIGTGEMVLPEHREYIETAFETRFVNEYGCSEAGIIGFECPQGRMHVMTQNVFVEVVKDGRSVVDEEGEIVVTELHAQTMPFIRYRMHDRGILLSERCACGLPFPLLSVAAGRIDGYLTLPSGRKVYDAVFAYTLKSGVAAFKAVQTALAEVRIYVVPNVNYSGSLMAHHLDVLRENTFGEIHFTVCVVDALPRERSGKLRYFVNELTSGSGWSVDAKGGSTKRDGND
jgi:phenylacetate-CoA ligase